MRPAAVEMTIADSSWCTHVHRVLWIIIQDPVASFADIAYGFVGAAFADLEPSHGLRGHRAKVERAPTDRR